MIQWVILLVFVCSATVYSQTAMDEMSASGLLNEASGLLAEDQYRAAVPYLQMYLKRMDDVEDERVLVLTQMVRLKLGQLMAVLEDPSAAVVYLQEYTEHLPLYRPREAYKLLAVNLFAMDAYEEYLG